MALSEAQTQYIATLRDLGERLQAAAEAHHVIEGLAAGGERAVLVAHTGLEMAIEVEEHEADSR